MFILKHLIIVLTWEVFEKELTMKNLRIKGLDKTKIL